MSSVALETLEPQVDRSRQVAWRVAWTLPLLVLIATSAMRYEPAHFWQSASGILLLTLVIAAAVTDLLWCRIPNWLTYPAFCWAICINLLSTALSPEVSSLFGAVGIADSLAGGCIPFFFMLVIFSMTGGGAGDVKLTAAMGAFLGLSQVIDAILLSFIFAGGFALIRAVWLLGLWEMLQLLYRRVGSWVLPLWIQPPSKEQVAFMRQPMPLGPSFALGTALVVFDVNVQYFVDKLNIQ